MSMLDGLPEKLRVGDREIRINTDFRVWIAVERLLFDPCMTDAEKLSGMMVLALPEMPDTDLGALAAAMLDFCFGDTTERKAGREVRKKPVFDYEADAEYIFAAFLSEFGIDLTQTELHWHKFRALLKSVGDGCRLSKIIGYRSCDTSKIKDSEMRKYYESMKRLYSLPDKRSEDEREDELVDSFDMFF